MYLKSLTVSRAGDTVRHVEFRRGLNLIVDETSEARLDSGNSVGKTTCLRAIDYCLGGNPASMYEDREFRKQNQSVRDFVVEGGAVFELVLEPPRGGAVALRRAESPTILSINGEGYKSLAQYNSALGALLFNLPLDSKPTFRQAIKKFGRTDPGDMDNALHFLHSSTTKSKYMLLWLFLFGFTDVELLARRDAKQREIAGINRNRRAFKAESQKGAKAVVRQLDRQIKVLQASIDGLELKEIPGKEADDLTALRGTIRSRSLSLTRAKIRLQHAHSSIGTLDSSTSRISANEIRRVYDEARVALPTLTAHFEEVQEFHNSLIEQRRTTLKQLVIRERAKIARDEADLQPLVEEERQILLRAKKAGALVGLSQAFVRLAKLQTQRSGIVTIQKKIAEIEGRQATAQSELDALGEAIARGMKSVSEWVDDFNDLFGDISEALDGERKLLVSDLIRSKSGALKHVEFSFASTEPVASTGTKRYLIAGFDLAYLVHSGKSGTQRPLFTMHDMVENISKNQLQTIFDTADNHGVQLIVAVLQDRIDELEFPSEAIRLELNRENRFFRLP